MSFPAVNPTTTESWKKLNLHAASMKAAHMRNLFIENPNRFNEFSQKEGDLLFDYSKNLITAETLDLLTSLAKECRVSEAIEAMFNGEKINQTENRAVLHTALRNFSQESVMTDGVDVMPGIKRYLHKWKHCAVRFIPAPGRVIQENP